MAEDSARADCAVQEVTGGDFAVVDVCAVGESIENL